MEELLINFLILKEIFIIMSIELLIIYCGRGIMDGLGDVVWILISVFIIFIMILGFGLVEFGKCNLINI